MSSSTAHNAIVNGRHLHWLQWGEPDGKPLLALHGWLDNAASFEVLGPLLKDSLVVAPDLPGHGFSDHRAAPGTYNIWDDLLDLLALADHLGWERFGLVGHSRGAVIANLLAGSMPERIDRLILLDGIMVGVITDAEAPQQLGKFLNDQRADKRHRLPRYESLEAALAVRCKTARMSELAARPIVLRGLYRGEDEYWYWRSDPRLTLASAVKFNAAQAQAILQAVTCPVLLVVAADGYIQHAATQLASLDLHGLRQISVAGSHHCHMEASAVVIAAQLNPFLAASPAIVSS